MDIFVSLRISLQRLKHVAPMHTCYSTPRKQQQQQQYQQQQQQQ